MHTYYYGSVLIYMQDLILLSHPQVYVHDKKLTVGKLTVSLLECSRLSQVEGARSVYCTLSVGEWGVVSLSVCLPVCLSVYIVLHI